MDTMHHWVTHHTTWTELVRIVWVCMPLVTRELSSVRVHVVAAVVSWLLRWWLIFSCFRTSIFVLINNLTRIIKHIWVYNLVIIVIATIITGLVKI